MDPGSQGRRTGNACGLSLRGNPPWIKVCGVKQPEDILICHEAGVDSVGLNFYPSSPRFINQFELERASRSWPDSLAAVALFVTPAMSEVWELIHRHPWINLLQFHGLANPPSEPPPRPWILAGAAQAETGFAPISDLLSRCLIAGVGPCAVILDGHRPGMHGGTGQKAPWELVKTAEWPIPVILAGGINPENAAEAMTVVKPWGLDVASGVESAPGVKDRDAIFRLVARARQEISSGASDRQFQ